MSYVKIYTGTEDIDDLIGSLVQDGDKYYQYNTRNVSFIVTAKQLKEHGVANHNFMLTLYDKSLATVNPFNKGLTSDVRARIMCECRKNIWYYLRELALTSLVNGFSREFAANIANISQTWCFINNIDSHLISVGEEAYAIYQHHILAWALCFGTTDTRINIIDKSLDNSMTSLKQIKKNISCLPLYLQFEFENKKELIKLEVSNNAIVAKPKATSKEQAANIARGLTYPIQFFNYFEYIPFIKTILDESAPAYEVVKNMAIVNNTLYGRMFTSIAGDLSNKDSKDAYRIIKKFRKWNEKVLDRNINSVKRCNTPFYIEYGYKDIGLDDSWYVRMKNILKNDDNRFKREVLLERV